VLGIPRFLDCLRLVPIFARLARRCAGHDPVFLHSLADLNLQGVDRDAFLKELCQGQRVLHFGFVDSPFSAEKAKSGLLLHQKLRAVAKFIYGLDIDAACLEQYRQLTSDYNNSILDIQVPLPQADFLAANYQVILFGEILEHLLHPAAAMANLRLICAQNPGARLCITVPNAYSIMGFFTALSGAELVHPDHYFYFSPVTLRKLIRDTGFELIQMCQYGESVSLASPGITKHGLIALCTAAAGLAK
jgi:2-polyprenyl-3-methyl-5-hydroxy-6-metoxy-1,4-benzoquinol methylase